MIDQASNLLGVVGLEIATRIVGRLNSTFESHTTRVETAKHSNPVTDPHGP